MHYNLKRYFQKGVGVAKVSLESKMVALRDRAMTAETILDHTQLMEPESEEKFLGEHDAACATLHEVVSALRRIIKAREEMKN